MHYIGKCILTLAAEGPSKGSKQTKFKNFKSKLELRREIISPYFTGYHAIEINTAVAQTFSYIVEVVYLRSVVRI